MIIYITIIELKVTYQWYYILTVNYNSLVYQGAELNEIIHNNSVTWSIVYKQS
jgi:hypothetical protein